MTAVTMPAILTPFLLLMKSTPVSISSTDITAISPRVSSFGNISRSISITRKPMAAIAMTISASVYIVLRGERFFFFFADLCLSEVALLCLLFASVFSGPIILFFPFVFLFPYVSVTSFSSAAAASSAAAFAASRSSFLLSRSRLRYSAKYSFSSSLVS